MSDTFNTLSNPSSYDQTSICKFMPLHFANVAPCVKCLDMSEDSSAVQILWHFSKSRFWNVQANVNSSKFQDTFSLTLAGGAQNISRINFRALRAQILVAPEGVWLLRSQTLAFPPALPVTINNKNLENKICVDKIF